jgi:hypothetical protein
MPVTYLVRQGRQQGREAQRWLASWVRDNVAP